MNKVDTYSVHRFYIKILQTMRVSRQILNQMLILDFTVTFLTKLFLESGIIQVNFISGKLVVRTAIPFYLRITDPFQPIKGIGL